jgi:hypothetical protein
MFRQHTNRVGLLVIFFVMLSLMSASLALAVSKDHKGNKIVEENKQPGTTQWDSPELRQAIKPGEPELFAANSDPGGEQKAALLWSDTQAIKGYANKASINHGEAINLHVSTTQPSYTIEIYRFGWYGGTGARLITTTSSLVGRNYGIPLPDPDTGLIECNWPVGYTLQTTSDWLTGMYQAKLIASNGAASYIIFVVREDGASGGILFPIALTTYQVYNNWGGKSLYDHNSTGARAAKVSFDRPYDHNGVGAFYDGDYNMIRWLESQGYDVSYTTSQDLHANPNLAANHKMILINWHDEYWSKNMRDNVQAARDRGKHVAFFTANSAYWQIRFENSTRGVPLRIIVCYKDATADPMAHSSTPWLTTVLWRDPIVNRPENELMGVMYGYNFDYYTNYAYIVSNATHWIYEGTGLQNGSAISKVVGSEYDRVYDNGRTPSNLIILSRSPISATGEISNASIYTAGSGALVFDASTNRWSWLLDDSTWELTPADSRIRRMTTNLLNRMLGTSLATPTTAATATRTPTRTGPTATPNSSGGLKLQYRPGDTSATDNQIKPHLNILNLSGSAIPLTELKIRYYFTRDTNQTLAFTCHVAVVGCANLTTRFAALNSPLNNADYFLEIGFTSGAGNLAANGQTGDIFVRINKVDWSNFTETNDYSYDGTKTLAADWSKVTVYRNNTLVWGVEPGGTSITLAPTFAPPTSIPVTSTAVLTTGALKVQYMTGDSNASDYRLKPYFKIVNGGASTIPLSDLKIHYWFTRDSAQTVVFSCEYALRNCANVTGTLTYLSSPRPRADSYLEVGFTSAAGSLTPGSNSGPIQTFNNKGDWSNFDETNDYSFNASATTYVDSSHVTLYRNGALVWGTEP